jgi:hypothetical protein
MFLTAESDRYQLTSGGSDLKIKLLNAKEVEGGFRYLPHPCIPHNNIEPQKDKDAPPASLKGAISSKRVSKMGSVNVFRPHPITGNCHVRWQLSVHPLR